MNTKLTIGIIATIVWIAAIVGKHFWPDLDVGGITSAAMATLSGLGVYHIQDSLAPPQDQPKEPMP